MTIDGVKLFRGDDWVLVVPHPEEPLVRVWAEAGSEAGAEALVAETAALSRKRRPRGRGTRAAARMSRRLDDETGEGERRGMNVPEDLRYTKEHEWVRVEGDRLTVGITDFAQDALGDVVYVDVPETGTQVTAGEPFGEVESTKSVSDVYSPVSGTVVERNPR